MPTESLYINGALSYQEVFELAEKNNFDNATTNLLIEGLLQQNRGKTRRNFAFATAFATAEADCAPTAERSFVHIDWIDGESVVQAEETSVEDGFNKRFHQIEDDIDAINADIAKLFECLAELRTSAAARFTEIANAINATNGDVAECCNDDSGGVRPWPGLTFPPDVYQPFEPYPWPGIGGGGPRPSPMPFPDGPGGGWGGGWGGGPGGGWGGGFGGPVINPGDRWTNFGPSGPRIYPNEVVTPWNTTPPIVTGNGGIIRSSIDEDVAIIAGLNGRRIGLDEFNGQNMEVWSTSAGIVLTPTDKVPDADTKIGWTNPHIDNAGSFIGWAAENEGRIKDKFGGQEFTMREFSEAFGKETLGNGVSVGAFVNQLPLGTKAKDGGQVAGLVIDRARDNVLRDGAEKETVIGLVGMNAGSDVSTIEVTRMAGVDKATGDALAGMGIKTVADLAKADPIELDEKLAQVGGNPQGIGMGLGAQAQVLEQLLGGRPR